MSDLYANITETVQHDPDRPGVHTTVYADLHTGDRTVMAAALHAAADRIDPGDPEELADWAEQQAVDRAGLHDAIAAPWREAFRALTGARVEIAGPPPPARPGAELTEVVTPLRRMLSDIAAQLANAGYVADDDIDLSQALYDALADLARYGSVLADATDQPTYAHDADCNTVHDGPEPCPPPRCGARPDGSRCNLPRSHPGICIPQAAPGGTVHRAPAEGASLMPCCERSPFEAPGDRMTLSDDLVTCRSARDADKPVAADPPRERDYLIQLNRFQNEQLLTWLSTNASGGSISVHPRLTVDTVEGGGLLVRARPFRFDDRAAEDAEHAE